MFCGIFIETQSFKILLLYDGNEIEQLSVVFLTSVKYLKTIIISNDQNNQNFDHVVDLFYNCDACCTATFKANDYSNF